MKTFDSKCYHSGINKIWNRKKGRSVICFVSVMLVSFSMTACSKGVSGDIEPTGSANQMTSEKQINSEGQTNDTNGTNQTNNAAQDKQQKIFAESEKIAACYQDIYKKAEKEKTLDTLETKTEIIVRLGKEGYAAVDTGNQINMANAEQVENFCAEAEKQKPGNVMILLVNEKGGFIRYDLRTENGAIQVERSSVCWEKDKPKSDYYETFQSNTWEYTEKGYLFLERYHMSGYDGAPGQIAIRVKPLDQTLRDLNQTYVVPIGYERNNLLISDWNASDYSSLDFYDLYEKLYQMKYGVSVPYPADYEGVEYEIAKDEFEDALLTYLPVDSAVIEQHTIYFPDKQTYQYRPRGLYDAEAPYEPYPEVVASEELGDGTVKLTVETVWTRKLSDCAVKSELVVRPLDTGGFQYISNHVIAKDERVTMTWYSPRLTQGEWTEYYGE